MPEITDPIRRVTLRSGSIWIATQDGRIARYRPQTASIHYYTDRQSVWKNEWIEALAVDAHDRLWIGHYGDGVYVLDASTLKVIATYHHRSGRPTTLGSDLIQSLLISRDNSIWIGTGNSGLDRLDLTAPVQYFRLLQNAPSEDLDLGVSSIQGITETADGHLWLGTDGNGLFELTFAGGAGSPYRIERHYQKNLAGGIPSNYPYGLVSEGRDIYWLKTWGGLSRLDLRTKKCSNFLTEDSAEGKTSILALVKDLDGWFWFGSWDRGIARFRPENFPQLTFEWWNRKDPVEEVGARNRVEALHVDRHNRLWIGTFGAGLSVLDSSRMHFTDYPFKPDDPQSLSNNSILCFYQSDDQTLWIGTHGGGLNKMDLLRATFKAYTTSEGLPNNVVYGIEEDQQGRLWLSTNFGLSCFDPIRETFWNFDERDGLQGNEFNRHGHFRTASGLLFFGGINGVTWFDPQQIRPNEYRSPVAITTLTANQVPYPIRQGTRLSHHQNLIAFTFAALNFRQPEKNRYRYRLLPTDEKWIDGGNNNQVIFNQLRPGSYEFQVMGANNDGLWNPECARLRFSISPPWYQSTGAYILYVILLSAGFWGAYRFLLERQRSREEAYRLQELDAFKSRFYTNITHEFRTPLTVILGLSDQVRSNLRDKREEAALLIKRNGQNLLRLVNQMLDLSKLESGQLPLYPVQADLVRFLRYLLESYQSWGVGQAIELTFEAYPEEILMDFDPTRLQDIVSNLLSNAFKAIAESGRVGVVVKCGSNEVELSVTDSGRGIAPEHLPFVFDRFYQAPYASEGPSSGFREGSGIGLSLTRELVRMMGGRIEVQSEPGLGSCFKVFLPIRRTAVWEDHPEALLQYRPVEEPVRTAEVSGEQPGQNYPQLLIIEDHEDVLYYLRSFLENRYRLQIARDGQAGIEMALRDVPDLIICDVMLPLRSGLEVCRILKTDLRTSHIPIIMLTAKASMEDKLKGLRQGADVYLQKPFHREELETQIIQLTEQRRRLQQHYQQLDIQALPGSEVSEAVFLRKLRACILEQLDSENFGVEELAEAVFLSRTQLFRKVKALTGRSVAAYIHQVRIERVKNLLSTTDLTVSEIAYQTGFSDPSYLRRVFFKETGETLAEYRDRVRRS